MLWFLKCVFLCYIVAYIALHLTRSKVLAAVSTSVLFTVLPGADIVNFNFLLPMFWIGYGLRMAKDRVARHRKVIFTVSAIMYLGMLYFWNGYLTVYASPIDIIDWHSLTVNFPNLGITLFRLTIGTAGSIALFTLAPTVDKVAARTRFYPALLAVGKATLGIYVVQTLVVECGIHALGIYVTSLQSLVVAPLLACVFLPVCYLCVKAIKRSRIARLLLLGEESAPSLRLDVQQ